MLPELKAGQVVLLCTDWTRLSLSVAALLASPWTHVVLALGDGTVLSTYPATNAEIVPAEGVIGGRRYAVLDLADSDEAWRVAVVQEARRLVGTRYFVSPCSRVTALTFMRAGIDLFGSSGKWYQRWTGWMAPKQYLTNTRLKVVISPSSENPLL